MTYHGFVKNGQITLDYPGQLPDGTQVTVEIPDDASSKTQSDAPKSGNEPVQTHKGLHFHSRRQILQMPLEQRRQLLMTESERLASYYDAESERSVWQGGDIVE